MSRPPNEACVITIFVAVLVAVPMHVSAQLDDWAEASDPVVIAPGLYYVGSAGLGAFLLTSDEGHILIDAPLEENVEMVLNNIRRVGFDPRDVRIHLASHAHYDHVGGFEGLLEVTGGEVWLSEGDAPFVRSGTDFGFESDGYPAVTPARTFRHMETVTLGDIELTAHVTPGHTPGCTSWAGTVTIEEEQQSFVIACSVSVLSMYRLVGPEPTYPGHGADYCRGVRRLKALNPQIFLAGHGTFFDLETKATEARGGDPRAFVDPERYLSWIERGERAVEDALAEQGHVGGCDVLLGIG